MGGKLLSSRSWTNALADEIAGRIAWKMFSDVMGPRLLEIFNDLTTTYKVHDLLTKQATAAMKAFILLRGSKELKCLI